jgi:hypothetical protein
MWTWATSNRNGAARVVLSLGLLSGGCAYGELHQVLRAQVASEVDCPDITVEKSSPFMPGYNANQYNVRGCGVDRIYICKGDGLVKYGHANCTYTAGASTAKPTVAPPAESPELSDEPSDLEAMPPSPTPGAGDIGETTP